jgi:hypothetical protein
LDARTEVNKVGDDGTDDISDIVKDGPGGKDEVPSTKEFPDKTTNSRALVSSIIAEKTPTLGASQANNTPTSPSVDHTVSPTKQNNTQSTVLATQAVWVDPADQHYTSEPFILDSDAD